MNCPNADRRFLPRVPGIYRIRNAVTGDSYVGSTSSLRARFSVHQDCLRRGRHPTSLLRNSVLKHGIGVFIFEVLDFVAFDRLHNLGRIEAEFYVKLKPTLNVNVLSPTPTGFSVTVPAWARAARGKLISAGHQRRRLAKVLGLELLVAPLKAKRKRKK